jgi:exodeoxyribonuclease-3
VKIATWNVNSLNVRLEQVLAFLRAQQPDVLALQELKMPDERFPVAAFSELGYEAAFAGQKAYNGVAIVSRLPIEDVLVGVPGLEDPQRRAITATIAGVRVASLYVPNGQAVGTDKYEYKLGWLAAARDWLRAEAHTHEKLVAVGDFNVAPEERDVHDPKRWEGKVLVSEPERSAFRDLLGAGLQDTFRLFEQPEKSFTWWDYGSLALRLNWGLRIDHILATPALAARCASCTIDVGPRRNERPSDHAPVLAEFED